jgi:hypothetical protein
MGVEGELVFSAGGGIFIPADLGGPNVTPGGFPMPA